MNSLTAWAKCCGMCEKPRCLRTTAPFLVSTKALSLARVGGETWVELDAQLLQQPGHHVVDVPRAIVGVDPQDGEGELLEDVLQHGQEVGLADALAGGHDLPLGEAVHGVDVVDPLGPVLIALVNAVDADVAWAPIGLWRLAHADGYVV